MSYSTRPLVHTATYSTSPQLESIKFLALVDQKGGHRQDHHRNSSRRGCQFHVADAGNRAAWQAGPWQGRAQNTNGTHRHSLHHAVLMVGKAGVSSRGIPSIWKS